jgi:electron transport complex protein RnfD
VFVVSPSPHYKSLKTTNKVMWEVVFLLLPIALTAFLFYGIKALLLILVCVLTCVLTEIIIDKFMLKNKELSIKDGSAVITGILLAFCLSSAVPLWQGALGGFIAIALAKMTYGGLGKNIFNPALIGRAFLFICFPVEMTTWPKPKFMQLQFWDGETGATVLSLMKENLKNGLQMPDILQNIPPLGQLFFVHLGGCLGEISRLLLFICGVYLILRKIISWHIPVCYILTVFIFSYVLYVINPNIYASSGLHILSGGLLLGAFFMATDYVTSPMSINGKIIFAIGCGVMTVVIRNFASMPEGVSFSILFMNMFVPLIDKTFKPKVFGK